MAYEKQTWVPYDDNKTEEENIQAGAVVTAERMNYLETGLDEHDKNTTNPHKVTKAQVGLGNVANVEQATKTEFDSHTSSKTNPHSVTASQVGAYSKVESENRYAKPSDITKDKAGLGNVDNFATATRLDAEQGFAANAFMTPFRVKQQIDYRMADGSEVIAGQSSDKIVSPKSLKESFIIPIKISEWMNVPLASTAEAADNATPQYRIITFSSDENTRTKVEFRGAVRNSSTHNMPSGGSSLVVATLPENIRTAQTVIVPGATNHLSFMGRAATLSSGWLGVGNQSGTTLDYVYLNNLSYWLD